MKLSFMHRLIPAIITWLVVVIVLSLAPTIETYNGHVTTNVAAATNAAYMLGMTAVDDFGGFIMIMGLLLSSGLFAVTSMKVRDTSIGDMMEVIGAVILSVIALSMLSGTIVGTICVAAFVLFFFVPKLFLGIYLLFCLLGIPVVFALVFLVSYLVAK